MTFDPMRGPATVARGEQGRVFIGGLRAGVLTEWRVVISPTTKKPTLFGTGRIGRYYQQTIGGMARIELTPAPTPRRIGRPTPPTPRPFVLVGTIAELTSKTITIASGEIERGS